MCEWLKKAWRTIAHDDVQEAREEFMRTTIQLRASADKLSDRTRKISADDALRALARDGKQNGA